ncbi:MAG TPA: acid shock protein [Gemmataceae bacterium]|nr:acid shock protein [Gemmataceae bacterium]
MRKFLLSLVAGAMILGGLAFAPSTATAAPGHHGRVYVYRGCYPAYYGWGYHYRYNYRWHR